MMTANAQLKHCVPYLMQPADHCLVGGDPGLQGLEALAAAGIHTLVDMRPVSEWSGMDWGGAVERAGLDFHHLPIDGLSDIDEHLTRRLWAIYSDPACRPLFIHCASGNRVGAALALAGWRHGGMTPSQALTFGDQAGLTRLRTAVGQVMGLAYI